MTNKYELGAYYFPNYHCDQRLNSWKGEGWNEWQLIKNGIPRFEGHQQPKVPLWGYEDEADPEVMAKKISAAVDHSLNSFVFDWYWYEDGPFLEGALENGFLKAKNNDQLKFAIMWANHDMPDLFPAQRSRPLNLLANGKVSRQAFEAATDHIIAKYFSHPSYWKIDGRLYFSFYELMSLIKGLGDVKETKAALTSFREKTRKAGLGEIHLNAIVWGVQLLPGAEGIKDENHLLSELGFDSVTSYVWIHHLELPDFPKTSYPKFRESSIKEFDRLAAKHNVPYYPNVTIGWDASPRTIRSDFYDNIGYPSMPILVDNTPEEFKKALIATKKFLDKASFETKVLTINAWNEWTEGSYLEPDIINGMGYLEAIKEVFVKK